jgi:hypothetical protein
MSPVRDWQFMGVYGDIARRAWNLAAQCEMRPADAWKAAVGEQYPDPTKRKNALKHTCPKGAFLGLCQLGILQGIRSGQYTNSTKSSGYANKAVELLRANPALASDKARLERGVFGVRSPNDEVDVVLALWASGLIART